MLHEIWQFSTSSSVLQVPDQPISPLCHLYASSWELCQPKDWAICRISFNGQIMILHGYVNFLRAYHNACRQKPPRISHQAKSLSQAHSKGRPSLAQASAADAVSVSGAASRSQNVHSNTLDRRYESMQRRWDKLLQQP